MLDRFFYGAMFGCLLGGAVTLSPLVQHNAYCLAHLNACCFAIDMGGGLLCGMVAVLLTWLARRPRWYTNSRGPM